MGKGPATAQAVIRAGASDATRSPIGEFDYVIVGAGSAGCVLAARLSESGTYRVALLEAGEEGGSFWFRAPLGFGKLYFGTRYNWSYRSAPEKELFDARSFQARGKVVGGSGAINGMVYTRGQRHDFDLWRQLGNVGWSYEDVLPYFVKAEDYEGGESRYHGTGGPLTVGTLPPHELGEAFIAAAEQAGYARNDDFNGPEQEGFGRVHVNIRNGERCGPVEAYLDPARARRNLIVFTGAMALRVVIEGRRALGVTFRRANGEHFVRARGEVIVAGGTFNSPQLLQLSGAGPGDLLRDLEIPMHLELPGVGENLQDHLGMNLTYRCARPITINDAVNKPLRRYLMGAEYVFRRRGFIATNGHVAQGFVRSDPALAAPDLQLRLRIFSLARAGEHAKYMGLAPYSAFDLGTQLMHAESRGWVRINSPDAFQAPTIQFNSFSADRDQDAAIAGFRVARKIMSMPAIQPYIAEDLLPSAEYREQEIIDYWRRTSAALGHPTGTCRMGVDEMAVVDPRLRVRGLERLRVADASIMPRCVGANTNATTIMIAEKGAAMILEDSRM